MCYAQMATCSGVTVVLIRFIKISCNLDKSCWAKSTQISCNHLQSLNIIPDPGSIWQALIQRCLNFTAYSDKTRVPQIWPPYVVVGRWGRKIGSIELKLIFCQLTAALGNIELSPNMKTKGGLQYFMPAIFLFGNRWSKVAVTSTFGAASKLWIMMTNLYFQCHPNVVDW